MPVPVGRLHIAYKSPPRFVSDRRFTGSHGWLLSFLVFLFGVTETRPIQLSRPLVYSTQRLVTRWQASNLRELLDLVLSLTSIAVAAHLRGFTDWNIWGCA